jgi:hypothetical protein
LEAKISDLDGGGLAVHDSTHPAARQYRARQAELRWRMGGDEIAALGALYQAHVELVDDWIPFDSNAYPTRLWDYSFDLRGRDFVIRGPDFLLRVYAKALKARGERPRLVLRRSKAKPIRLKLLHFGSSYVVASKFVARRCEEVRSC